MLLMSLLAFTAFRKCQANSVHVQVLELCSMVALGVSALVESTLGFGKPTTHTFLKEAVKRDGSWPWKNCWRLGSWWLPEDFVEVVLAQVGFGGEPRGCCDCVGCHHGTLDEGVEVVLYGGFGCGWIGGVSPGGGGIL